MMLRSSDFPLLDPDPRRTFKFSYRLDRVHTLFVADLASQRERAGNCILTIACFAFLQFFVKCGDLLWCGYSFFAARAEDT